MPGAKRFGAVGLCARGSQCTFYTTSCIQNSVLGNFVDEGLASTI